jgi:hypothetical protein
MTNLVAEGKPLKKEDEHLVEPSELDVGIGRAIFLLSVIVFVTESVLRIITWDYKISMWVTLVPIPPIVFLSAMFLVFFTGGIKTLATRKASNPDSSGFRFDLLVKAIKTTTVGLMYTAILLLFLFHFRFSFGQPLVQLLALLKLGGTHLLYAGVFRNDWRVSMLHVFGGANYLALGLSLYLCKENLVLVVCDFVLGCSCILFSGGALTFGAFGSMVGLAVMSVSYFFSANNYPTLICVSLFVSGGLSVLYELSESTFYEIARVIALLFGSWARIEAIDSATSSILSSDLPNGSLGEIREDEPLLSSRTEPFIVIKN